MHHPDPERDPAEDMFRGQEPDLDDDLQLLCSRHGNVPCAGGQVQLFLNCFLCPIGPSVDQFLDARNPIPQYLLPKNAPTEIPVLLFPLIAHNHANLQANVLASWNVTECMDTTLGFQGPSPMTRSSIPSLELLTRTLAHRCGCCRAGSLLAAIAL